VHLAKILTDLKKSRVFEEKKKRVYLAVEALYANTGEICPLREIMRLKEQYPFRIILEESYSIGVLGKV
jgi:serine palmitoyltransferase